jgi:dihydroorotase
VAPVVDSPEVVAGIARELPGGIRLWPAAALTAGGLGVELTEVGLLRAAGAIALSDGGVPIRDSVVLRNAMEYARGFDLPILLRAADADLDALGVAHEGALAAELGLRGHPPLAEEIGVARAIALARATGARVHLLGITSARAVAMIAAGGGCVTASTAARNLVLDESVLGDGAYDTRYRLHPPLRSEADRAALVDAVRAGTLWLTADHQPRAPEEKEREFEAAVPGSPGLETAFAAAMTALGDLGAVVRALSTGPRSLVQGQDLLALPTGWAIVDPAARVTVDARSHRCRARDDALHGRALVGRVLGLAP